MRAPSSIPSVLCAILLCLCDSVAKDGTRNPGRPHQHPGKIQKSCDSLGFIGWH
jgi:hypothetical protein